MLGDDTQLRRERRTRELFFFRLFFLFGKIHRVTGITYNRMISSKKKILRSRSVRYTLAQLKWIRCFKTASCRFTTLVTTNWFFYYLNSTVMNPSFLFIEIISFVHTDTFICLAHRLITTWKRFHLSMHCFNINSSKKNDFFCWICIKISSF